MSGFLNVWNKWTWIIGIVCSKGSFLVPILSIATTTRRKVNFIVVVFWMVVIATIFSAIATIPTWLLWNWLMPDIFGLPSIGLFQAFGLLLLSGFLLGSRKVKIEAWHKSHHVLARTTAARTAWNELGGTRNQVRNLCEMIYSRGTPITSMSSWQYLQDSTCSPNWALISSRWLKYRNASYGRWSRQSPASSASFDTPAKNSSVSISSIFSRSLILLTVILQ